MKQFGMNQLIKEPTRYYTNKNSILDLFFTNSDIISKSGVSNVNVSDHQMVLLTRKKIKTIKQRCSFTGRSYRNYNKLQFQERIRNADWRGFDESQCPIREWEIMKQNIEEIIDNMCPIKTFKISKIKQPRITAPLIELIKDKDIALKNVKKKKDENLWKEAKRLRNICTNRLRKAKADYIKANLTNNHNNPKNFWKNIQEVLPTKNKGNRNILLSDPDTNDIVETEKVADYINDFFIHIGPNPYRNSIWVPYGPHLDSFVGPTWATHFGPKTKCPAGRNGPQLGYPCGLPTLDPIHFVRQVAMGLANANYVIPYYSQFMLSK